MLHSPSKTAAGRKAGKHQVEEQRASILDAAERLFLQRGLENTRMSDIAAEAGITRVTLYRYFANRDEIAVEIQVRMLHRIADLVAPEAEAAQTQPAPEGTAPEMAEPAGAADSLAGVKRRVQRMIQNFDRLRDAYRYIGMFDRIYLDNAPGTPLTEWTKAQLEEARLRRKALEGAAEQNLYRDELSVILNNLIWFLEKLALRGELTWSDPGTPLEEHLQFFEEMMLRAIDLIVDKNEG